MVNTFINDSVNPNIEIQFPSWFMKIHRQISDFKSYIESG